MSQAVFGRSTSQIRRRSLLHAFLICILWGSLGASSQVWAQALEKEAPAAEVKNVAKKDAAAKEKTLVVDSSDGSDGSDGSGGLGEKGNAADTSSVETTEILGSSDSSKERKTNESLNVEGALGFHKIASARIGKRYSFRAAFLGEVFSGSNVIRFNDQNTRTAGRLLVQGTLLDFLSVNFGLSASGNSNTFGQPEAMLSQGDLTLGVLGVYKVNDFLSVGADLNLMFPASFGSSGLTLSGASVRPRMLASLDFRSLSQGSVPIDAHINLAFTLDGSEHAIPEGLSPTRIERFAYRISAYDYVELGVGAEYDLPYVRPFAGVHLALPTNGGSEICNKDTPDFKCATNAGFGAFPKVLSLGLRAEPVEYLGVHLGVDVGLAPVDAQGVPVTLPYNVIFGLSWTIDPTPKVELVETIVEKEKVVDRTPERGYIMGAITDADTKEPVKGAVIEYVGTNFTPQSSSVTNGSFRSYGIPPETTIKMRITHPDYEPVELPQLVGKGEVPMSVTLKAIPKKADITGRVRDSKDKPIRLAKISILGMGDAFTARVDAAGNFSQTIKPGKYSITVSSPNHLTKGRTITIDHDQKLALDFVLPRKPKKTLAKIKNNRIEIKKKVFFKKNDSKILSRSYQLLDAVAAVLLESADKAKKVRIEGHTDDTGGADYNLELSQKRAESVRRYLMEQGVSPDRLEAKGYGSKNPLLPNINRRNRSTNRRVEFRVIDPAPK